MNKNKTFSIAFKTHIFSLIQLNVRRMKLRTKSCKSIGAIIIISLLCFSGVYAQVNDDVYQTYYKYLKEKYEGEFLSKIRKKENYSDLNIAEERSGADISEIKMTDITNATLDEGEPTIAINPTNPDNIVASFVANGIGGIDFNGVVVYYSMDGGESWTLNQVPTDTWLLEDFGNLGIVAAEGADYVLEFDNNGRVYMVWLQPGISPLNPEKLHVATYWGWSDDGGATFQVADELDDRVLGFGILPIDTGNLQDLEGRFVDRPWLTVDNSGGPNDGTVYIQATIATVENDPVWPDSFFGSAHFYKTPSMTGFAVNPENVGSYVGLDEVIQTTLVNLYVDSEGVLHSIFASFDENFPDGGFSGNIHHIVSSDAGQSFTDLEPNITYENVGPTVTHDRENPMPDGVSHPTTESIHMVYGKRNAGDGIQGDYVRSMDNGDTWEAPISIIEMLGATEELSQILHPTITVDGVSGRISIAFMAQDSSNFWNYYISSSTDEGNNWDPICKISTDFTDFSNATFNFFGDYWETKMVNDKSYCIWADGRGGSGSKVYVAIVDHRETVNVSELSSITDNFKILNLSPNPASDRITLSVDAKQNMSLDMSLLSIDGKQLHHIQKRSIHEGAQQIDITIPNSFTNGTYILKLNTSVGLFTRKVIVNR